MPSLIRVARVAREASAARSLVFVSALGILLLTIDFAL